MGLGNDELAALESLWFAAGSITSGRPRKRWMNNFADPPGPAWVWLRPSSLDDSRHAQIDVSAWWGEPLRAELTRLDCQSGGVIVQLPLTVPNPPLEITFADVGWADFGRGRVPRPVAEKCKAIYADARDIIEGSPGVDPPLTQEEERSLAAPMSWARYIAAGIGVGWAEIFAPHTGLIRPRITNHALDGAATGWSGSGEDLLTTDGFLARQLMLTGAEIRERRESRGLSREDVREQLADLEPARPVGPHLIEHLESGGRIPKEGSIIAALDHVLGCDGLLGVDPVFDSVRIYRGKRDTFDVGFPTYSVGPIWVQPKGPIPDSHGTVDLLWGPWRRTQRVRSGMLLTTRKASTDAPPLRIRIPTDWRVVVGVGAVSTATDINRGWHPATISAAVYLLRTAAETLKHAGALERSRR